MDRDMYQFIIIRNSTPEEKKEREEKVNTNNSAKLE